MSDKLTRFTYQDLQTGREISIDLWPGEEVYCPNCGGTGDDPTTMICVMCGGDGVLQAEDDDDEETEA